MSREIFKIKKNNTLYINNEQQLKQHKEINEKMSFLYFMQYIFTIRVYYHSIENLLVLSMILLKNC